MASALDPYTPSETAARPASAPGLPQIPGLDFATATDPTFAQGQQQVAGAHEQQFRQEQQQIQAGLAQDQRTAQGRISAFGQNPQFKGRGYNELNPNEVNQVQSGVPTSQIPQIPGLWNAAQTASTGRPVGARINPGETASADVNGVKISNIVPTGSAGMTYESLPDSDQRIVDQIGNYQMPMPSRGAFPPAQIARIRGALSDKYGPDSEHPYDAKEYPARQAALTDFKAGKAASNITSIQTVIGHLRGLSDAVGQLGNTNFLPGISNTVVNDVGNVTSSGVQAKLANFNSKADAVASELGKVFGGNQPAMSLVHEWRNSISANASPQAQNAAIGSIMEMLGSRMGGLQDQWDKGVKSERTLPFLTDKNRADLQAMEQRGVPDSNHIALDPVGAFPQQGQANPAVPATPQPAATAAPQAAPQIPVLTGRSQFDALPSGSLYIRNGQRYKKP